MTEDQPVAQHSALLAKLSSECPNSINIIASPHPIRQYTCLVHVFDFTDRPEYIEIAKYGFDKLFAGADFAHWLIERAHLVEVAQVEAQDGDLVFYFNEGSFKHAGLWRQNGRVLSKWGDGHLYDHELFEVPISYGTDIRFYKRPTYEIGYGLFKQFAEENGFRFQNADQ